MQFLRACLFVFVLANVASANVITVDTPYDMAADDVGNETNGYCSLREAINSANLDVVTDTCQAGNGDDTIVFDRSLDGQTITVSKRDSPFTQTHLYVPSSALGILTIDGGSTITVQAGESDVYLLRISNSSVVLRNITLTGGLVTIRNQGGSNLHILNSTISGGGENGIWFTLGGALVIIDSTISGHGWGTNPRAALYLDRLNRFVIANTTITGNRGYFGGGLFAWYTPGVIINSTISWNEAWCGAGALLRPELLAATMKPEMVYLNNVTVVENTATTRGGGIDSSCAMLQGGVVSVANSIFANNKAAVAGNDCYGYISSRGHNLFEDIFSCSLHSLPTDLIGIDPMLDILGFYGGPTQTMPPLIGSPVIDAADPAVCLTNKSDQRGFDRSVDGTTGIGSGPCDIGAVEWSQ